MKYITAGLLIPLVLAGCRPNQEKAQQEAQEERNERRKELAERDAELEVFIEDFKENEMDNYVDEDGNPLSESEILANEQAEREAALGRGDLTRIEMEALARQSRESGETEHTGGLIHAGIDINPGRYVIQKQNNRSEPAAITRLDTDDATLNEEMLDPERIEGPASVVWTLYEGQKVETEDDDSYVFTPIPYSSSTPTTTKYSAGEHIVGLDIRPGTYNVQSESGMDGIISITPETQSDGVVESVGSEPVEITLNEGDILEVIGIQTLSVQLADTDDVDE